MPTTTFLELDDQTTGSNNNTWGDVADSNFVILEQAIARLVSIATTGGTTVLTSSQNRNAIIRLTGTLSSNATIQVRTAEKNWTFINDTTGAFSVTVRTASGSGKTLPRGRAVKLYCDGTNVEHARYNAIPVAQAGGTVDAITATFEPAMTVAELQDGSPFIVEAAGANTSTTPSFSPDGLTARTITKNGGQALAVGDIRAAGHKLLLVYDTTSTRYELLNPAINAASETASGAVELATDAETQTGTDTTRAITPANLTAKEATVANFRANAADRILTTDIVYSAAAEVTLTDAATIAVDMATFINAVVTLSANRTLGQPSNTKAGQGGCIRIVQDGTGSRTLAYHADWKFAGGTDPVLSTAPNAEDLLFYHVVGANKIFAQLNKAIA